MPILRNLGSITIQAYSPRGSKLYAGDIAVIVDLEKLVHARGAKALFNKEHTTKLANGAIVLRASNVVLKT